MAWVSSFKKCYKQVHGHIIEIPIYYPRSPPLSGTSFSSTWVFSDRSLNMGGGGGAPIFSQASKGGPLSFSQGQ